MAFKELLAQIGTEASRIRQTIEASATTERQAALRNAQASRNAQQEQRVHREKGRRIGEQLWQQYDPEGKLKQILDTCGLDQRSHMKKFVLPKDEREKRTSCSPKLEGSCNRGVGIYELPLPLEFLKPESGIEKSAKMEVGIDYSDDRRIKFRVYGGNNGIKPDVYSDNEIIWEIDALAPDAETQLNNAIAQAWQKRVVKKDIIYSHETFGNQGWS